MSGGSTNQSVSPLPLTTAGLRSSGAILGVPGIAELISQTGEPPSVDSVSPSQFHVSGVFTDPQFALITRFLKQSKGTDLVTVPSVVTKSGQKASIRVVREFPYPTEFDPPQVPQQVGSVTIGNVNYSTGSNAGPVTPTTPTNFETKELGVVLEVEPNVSEDGRTVDIAINPSITDFEGFIDYGSDITNSFDLQTFSLFAPTTSTTVPYVQDNDVLQPVFRKNSANTAVTIYDGSTIMLGGVMEERRVDIQDKVPVIGDIPLIGRLWQTKVSQTSKKHVIFFITVTVIDPSGHRINQVAASPQAGQ
jgi:general secretion pathway protein D